MLSWPGRRFIPLKDLMGRSYDGSQESIANERPFFNQKYLDLYRNYFQQPENGRQIITAGQKQKLSDHGITFLLEVGSSKSQEVHILRTERGGAVVIYQVRLGYLSMEVTLVNVKGSCQDSRPVIEKGSFGDILNAWAGETPCMAKRMTIDGQSRSLIENNQVTWSFKSCKEKIKGAVLEYAFNLVASALEIGPRVRLSPSFDLVCYQDKVFFLMESCAPLMEHVSYPTIHLLQKRLKYCARLLHRFNIVHRDIKPSNIVFSRSLNDFVLIDFGISMAVWEKPGFLSVCYREGTARFMSSEMKMLKPEMAGRVDLFWNDAHGLAITIIEVKRALDLGESVRKLRGDPIPTSVDQAVELAYAIYKQTSNHQTLLRCTDPIVVENAKTMFGNSFPEILSEKCSLVESDGQFLVRCLGFTPKVLAIMRSSSLNDAETLDALSKLIQNDRSFYMDDQEPCQISSQTPISNIQNQITVLRAKMQQVKDPSFEKDDLQERIAELLAEKADFNIERGSIQDIREILHELKKESSRRNKKQAYGWLSAIIQGNWTPQLGPPPEPWRQSVRFFVQSATLSYWSKNIFQAKCLLSTLLSNIFGMPSKRYQYCLIELIQQSFQALTVAELDIELGIVEDCYEPLFLMLVDHLAREMNWKEVLCQCNHLLASKNTPRMLLGSVHFYRGCALQLLQSYQEAFQALSESFASITEQPRTSRSQLAVVQLYTARCQRLLGRHQTAYGLFQTCEEFFGQTDPKFSQHHFWSVSSLAEICYDQKNFTQAAFWINKLRHLFKTTDTSQWLYHQQSFYSYFSLLFWNAKVNLCNESAEEMLSLIDLSIEYLDDSSILPSYTQKIVGVLLSCLLCGMTKKEELLELTLQRVLDSLMGRIEKKAEITLFADRQGVLTAIASVKNLEDEFVCLSAVLMFKHVLKSEHREFQQVAETLKSRIDLHKSFSTRFWYVFSSLQFLLTDENDAEGAQLLVGLQFTTSPQNSYALALCYKAKGNYTEARESFNEYLSLQGFIPNNPGVLSLMATAECQIARTYQIQGMEDEYRSHYRKSLELYLMAEPFLPNVLLAKTNITRTHMYLGEYRQALAWLKKTPQLWRQPTVHGYSYYLLATCSVELKQYRMGLWAVTKARESMLSGVALAYDEEMVEQFRFYRCCCMVGLGRLTALRRFFDKIDRAENGSISMVEKLRTRLSQQSNVLAYAVLGVEPLPDSNLHKFLHQKAVKLRSTRKVLQQTIVVKKILRLLVVDSETRRPLLKERKKALLGQLGFH